MRKTPRNIRAIGPALLRASVLFRVLLPLALLRPGAVRADRRYDLAVSSYHAPQHSADKRAKGDPRTVPEDNTVLRRKEANLVHVVHSPHTIRHVAPPGDGCAALAFRWRA